MQLNYCPGLAESKRKNRIETKLDFRFAFGAGVILGEALITAGAFDFEFVSNDMMGAFSSGPFLPANVP